MAILIGGIDPLLGRNNHIVGLAEDDIIFGDPFLQGTFQPVPDPNLGGVLSAGKGGNDHIDAGGGGDYVVGDAGAMAGTARGGSDHLVGGEGRDFLIGDAGKDLLDGGADNDRADYQTFNGGNITIALGANGAASTVKAAAGTDPAGDTLKNVENIWGGKGDDILVGNALANEIHGGDGDDLIQGGGGADFLLGDGNAANNSSLNDTLSYSQSKAGVTVTIHAPTVQTGGSGGDAQGDTIVNFENLIGSAHNDVLRSAAPNQVNTIKGGGGDDTVEGFSGADNLFGEAGI